MSANQTIPSNRVKPYHSVAIEECGEALVPIPQDRFVLFDPAPYKALGADYKGSSPWMIRTGVLKRLLSAQTALDQLRSGWKIMLFDIYRPRYIQEYMVQREFAIKAREAGLNLKTLSSPDYDALADKVFKYWAVPSDDPATPPPHSTGAALDITLADDAGMEADMGSPIDEGAAPAAPGYFAKATDAAGKNAHANRLLLHGVMHEAGFLQHPEEWWHFSFGDQMWAYDQNQKGENPHVKARYGRADLLKA